MKQLQPTSEEYIIPITKNIRVTDYPFLRADQWTPLPPPMRGCKGFCGMNEFKDKHDPRRSSRWIPYGKYCSRCEVHLQRNIALVVFCPCCGTHLRIKPKNKSRKR